MMTENKLTFEEIKKALEYLPDRILTETERMAIENALDLINRQQAEIERLNVELVGMRGACNSYKMHYDNAKAEIERLRENNKAIMQTIADVHTEAIKEFANEFEYEILHKKFWNDHPHTSQVWLNGYEQCMRDMRVMLKDKIKEMVGEDK